MFADKARAYPKGEHLKDLHANIRLGWKDLPWTNTNLLGTFLNYSSKKFDNSGVWILRVTT